MTSCSQSKHWTRPSAYHCNAQWTRTYSREQSFVRIRKSRKGTQLNIPEMFFTVQMEKSLIEQIPILPSGGCCDMEYVMYRQNALKRQIATKHSMRYMDGPRYSPSVTINIGTSEPFNHSQYYGLSQQNISYSTISINPTVVSEEPWQKKEVIPLGIYCCGKPRCEHGQSKEQKVVSLDGAETNEKLVDDKGFVYVTKTPTISPLKECWKFFSCKKRQKKTTGTYMPTVMTKTEPRECKVCPKTEVSESRLFRTNRDQPYAIRSKLSTITESEITVSEYSSEEFVSQENKEKKEKRKFQYPKKVYTGTGKMLEDNSLHSDRYSSAIYNAHQFYQPEGIHRWVCTPVEEKKRLFNFVKNKKYICYKEQLE